MTQLDERARRSAIALHGFTRWLLSIRFVTIAMVAAVVAFARYALAMPLRYDLLLTIVAAVLAYNTALWIYLREAGERAGLCHRCTPALVHLQMTLDQLALTAVLYLSGGVENPFVIVFLGHMVLAAVLFPPRRAVAQSALGGLLVAALALAQWAQVAPPHPLPGFSAPPGALRPLGFAGAIELGGFSIVYLTLHIMTELRRRREQVLALHETLAEKNEALRRSVSRLERIDVMRRRLLAIASHDLKAPLATVESYVDVLLGGYVGSLTDKQKEILGKCDRRLKGLRQFIYDILQLARLERKGIVQDLEPTDLRKVLELVLEDARVQAEEKGVRLRTAVPDDLPLVKGSPSHLGQVFSNLLSNALKFTPRDGEVSCAVRVEPDALVAMIEDTGEGIDPEDLPHIFDEFYRAKKGRRSSDGSGLGLFTVQAIVKAHGGQVGVDSRLGEGSRFWFSIPRDAHIEAATRRSDGGAASRTGEATSGGSTR